MSRELQTELALLMHARFLRMRSMDRALRIHPGQFQILMVLQEQQGLTQRGVAGLLGVRPPSVNAMIKRMEHSGYIRRARDGEDGRAQRIYLTDEGIQLARRAVDIAGEVDRDMFRGFAPEDEAQLLGYLRRMRENLCPPPRR